MSITDTDLHPFPVPDDYLRFVHALCNYDIQTPILAARHLLDILALPPPITAHQQWVLASIADRHERVLATIRTIKLFLFVTRHPHILTTPEQLIISDIQPFLFHAIDTLHQQTTYRNLSPHDGTRSNGITWNQEIPSSLPPLFAVAWISNHLFDLSTQILITATNVQAFSIQVIPGTHHVTIRFGWSALYPDEFLQGIYALFTPTSSGLDFSDRALPLFLIWKLSHAIGGTCHFTIQASYDHVLEFLLPTYTAPSDQPSVVWPPNNPM